MPFVVGEIPVRFLEDILFLPGARRQRSLFLVLLIEARGILRTEAPIFVLLHGGIAASGAVATCTIVGLDSKLIVLIGLVVLIGRVIALRWEAVVLCEFTAVRWALRGRRGSLSGAFLSAIIGRIPKNRDRTSRRASTR